MGDGLLNELRTLREMMEQQFIMKEKALLERERKVEKNEKEILIKIAENNDLLAKIEEEKINKPEEMIKLKHQQQQKYLERNFENMSKKQQQGSAENMFLLQFMEQKFNVMSEQFLVMGQRTEQQFQVFVQQMEDKSTHLMQQNHGLQQQNQELNNVIQQQHNLIAQALDTQYQLALKHEGYWNDFGAFSRRVWEHLEARADAEPKRKRKRRRARRDSSSSSSGSPQFRPRFSLPVSPPPPLIHSPPVSLPGTPQLSPPVNLEHDLDPDVSMDMSQWSRGCRVRADGYICCPEHLIDPCNCPLQHSSLCTCPECKPGLQEQQAALNETLSALSFRQKKLRAQDRAPISDNFTPLTEDIIMADIANCAPPRSTPPSSPLTILIPDEEPPTSHHSSLINIVPNQEPTKPARTRLGPAGRPAISPGAQQRYAPYSFRPPKVLKCTYCHRTLPRGTGYRVNGSFCRHIHHKGCLKATNGFYNCTVDGCTAKSKQIIPLNNI